jgi:acetylxylan esterase
MSTSLRRRSSIALVSLSVLVATSHSWAATWQNGKSYGGSGPTMDLYVPDNADASPGIIVILHYCGGNSGATHGWLQGLADQHGFLLIAPSVGVGKNCWNATPTRGGELASIVQMVDFVANEEAANRARVFAAGASSGACMTNALLAAYPEVFAGGSVLAGVPAGAWTGGNTCGSCGQNPPNRTAQQWGDLVRSASPNFMGTRPRVQLFHGTADSTLNYPNLAAEVLQWTNVLGVTDQDATMQANQPKSGWNRTSYTKGGSVVLESVIGQGQPHDLTGLGLWPDVVRFFGLDGDAPPGTGGSGGMGGTSGAAGTGTSAGAGGSLDAGGAGNGGAGPAAGTGGSGDGNRGGTDPAGGGPTAGGTGGATAGAGGVGTGGVPSAGGMTNTGGGVTTGGSGGVAGSVSAGGSLSTGGATPAASGAAGSISTGGTGTGGTALGTGGSTGGSGNDGGDTATAEGCACRVAGASEPPLAALAGWLALGFGLLARRRRS